MSSLFRCACVVVLLAGSAGTVCAAPATPEGAARITSGLQTYLGSKEGVVTVVPNGAVYDVTVDFAPLVSQLDLPDAVITISPQHLQITDQGEGLWGVKQDEPFRYEINSPGVKVAFSARSNKGEGTFDEKVGWLSQWSSDMVDFTITQRIAQSGTNLASSQIDAAESYHAELTVTAAASGGVDLNVHGKAKGFTQDGLIPVATSKKPMPGSFSASNLDTSVEIRGLRLEQILRVLAWLVAHPSEIEIMVNQEEVRPIVRAALPLFASLDGEYAYRGNRIKTPFGEFSATEISTKVKGSGLVADGMFGGELRFDGIGVPPGLVPAWASQLIPTSANFDVTGSGFNLADPAALIVGAVNLKSEPILPAGMQTSLLSALLPDGTFDLTFAPAQVKSPLYELNYEGAMTIDVSPGAIPAGTGKVRLTGMDAILEALGKAPKDQTDVTIKGLMMARGIAKPGAVGELVWNIDAMTPGRVMVNSLDLTKIGAHQESAP